jgi:hypothetical protein
MRNISPENPIDRLLRERADLRQVQASLIKDFESAFVEYSKTHDSDKFLHTAAEINYNSEQPNLFSTSQKIEELNTKIAKKTNEDPVTYDNYQIKSQLYNGIVAIVAGLANQTPSLIHSFTSAGIALIEQAATLSDKQLHKLSISEPRTNFANDGEYLARNLAKELKPFVQALPEQVKNIIIEALPELFTAE